jgi:hypothetical protein
MERHTKETDDRLKKNEIIYNTATHIVETEIKEIKSNQHLICGLISIWPKW